MYVEAPTHFRASPFQLKVDFHVPVRPPALSNSANLRDMSKPPPSKCFVKQAGARKNWRANRKAERAVIEAFKLAA